MKRIERKIRIELIRENEIFDTIEPDMNLEGDGLNLEITSSMHSFPMLYLKSKNKSINGTLLSFAKKDIIRCSMALNNSDNYDIVFEGDFLNMQIKGESSPDSLELSIKSIHSFYRLSLFELPSEKNYNNVFFKDFIKDIINIVDINIEVYIEPKIADIKLLGVSCNTNLFRIFKEVCLIIGAVVTFNNDNTVDIKSRNLSLKELKNQEVITIHKKDISSFTIIR